MANSAIPPALRNTKDVLLWKDIENLIKQLGQSILVTMITPIATEMKTEEGMRKKEELLANMAKTGKEYGKELAAIKKRFEDGNYEGIVDMEDVDAVVAYTEIFEELFNMGHKITANMLAPAEELALYEKKDEEKESEETEEVAVEEKEETNDE